MSSRYLKAKSHPIIIAGTGPGDPELLTVKAQIAIASADVIVYDATQIEHIIDFCQSKAKRVKINKDKTRNSDTLRKEIIQILADYHKTGKRVVRLKTGDAFMFGSGAAETELLFEMNLPFSVIPGITAGMAAAVYGNVRISEKKEADTVTFYMANQKNDQHENLEQIAQLLQSRATVALYMAENILPQIRDYLLKQKLPKHFPVVAVANASLPNQQVLSTTLADIQSILNKIPKNSSVVFFIGKKVHSIFAAPNQSE